MEPCGRFENFGVIFRANFFAKFLSQSFIFIIFYIFIIFSETTYRGQICDLAGQNPKRTVLGPLPAPEGVILGPFLAASMTDHSPVARGTKILCTFLQKCKIFYKIPGKARMVGSGEIKFRLFTFVKSARFFIISKILF